MNPMYTTESSGPVIIDDKCLSCGQCVTDCDFGALVIKLSSCGNCLLKTGKNGFYAAVAPAIAGQYGDNITMGRASFGPEALWGSRHD